MKVNNLLKIKQSSNKGITLIALVITIIVLLILAGVSIAMLTGENGILTQANTAKTKTAEAEILEEIKLAYNSVQTDSYVNNWDINKKAEELQKELQKGDSSATVTVDGTNLNVSYKGYETTISENGTIGELAKSKIVINEFYISGTPAETVPVPEGFYHVGGTADEGYVISDNVADEGAGVDADLVGNQFVWVPVEKDQKITINVSSEEEITSLVLTDPYGDELEIPAVSGTEYNEEIEPTINGPYRLVVKTASGEKKVFLNVHSLYAVDSMGDWDATEEYAQECEGYENLQAMLEDWYGEGATVEDLLMDGAWMKDYTETEDYTASVNTNGGFYIARYEATYEDGKVASKKATADSRTSSTTALENGMLWNHINQEDALTNAKAYNTSVNSTLPTGAAWDRVLGWLYETEEKTWYEILVNSTSWGNYRDDTFSNTASLTKPGEFEETKANNIYDLAGNVWEWTTEACDSTNRVSRGGGYSGGGGGDIPASRRYHFDPSFSDSSIGLRLTLFL